MTGKESLYLTDGLPRSRSGLQPNGLTKKQDDFCQRVAEPLSKTVGLFVEQQETPKLDPTIDELEAEIRIRLGMMKTVSPDQGDP